MKEPDLISAGSTIMKDKYGRIIKYLRLSVTDLCNYRCIYCMPEEGVPKKNHSDILSIEELSEIAEASYDLGITKIRLTGGEPLLRKGILTLCENIRRISDDIELSITTNGSLLPKMAKELKSAGVDRLNISLDTLDRDTFRRITRLGELDQTLEGIKAAQSAGFDNIKINTVLLGGVNDSEILPLMLLTKDNNIQLRFIELMPIGITKSLSDNLFVTVENIEKLLLNSAELTVDGVARVYRLPGYKGSIGLISPMSHSFCERCDKIRVTADGRLKPCLHSEDEISLKGLHGNELIQAIKNGIINKPMCHNLDSVGSQSSRNMNEIGG